MKKKAPKLSGGKLGTVTMQLAAELTLGEVQRILGREGIKVITLKGPFLGHTLYADPLERTYCDLDLLVMERGFARAFELLVRGGFTPAAGDPGRAATEDAYYNRALGSPLGVRVELHRALSGYARYRIDIDAMFARAVPFRMGKVRGLGFGPEDLLLHLGIHILKSYFVIEEKHIVDIARLVGARAIDWPAFLALARRAGCTAGTWYVLEAARRQHDAPVPADVLAALRPRGLRRLWLDRHLNPGAFPVYQYEGRNMWKAQIRLALPLVDGVGDWVPLLLRYARVRLRDAAAPWVRGAGHGVEAPA